MNDNFFEKHKKYILISTIVFVALCVFMVIYNSPTQKVKRVSQSIDTMISSYTEENAKGNLRGDIRGYLKDNPLPIGPSKRTKDDTLITFVCQKIIILFEHIFFNIIYTVLLR